MNKLAISCVALSGLWLAPSTPAQADSVECPATSPPTNINDNLLDAATDPGATGGIGGKNGVVYDDTTTGVGLLRLKKVGGNFQSVPLGIADPTVFAAPGDFNLDGLDDFVGCGESRKFCRVYINESPDNGPVNWDNIADVLTPKFVTTVDLNPAQTTCNGQLHQWHPVATGDFNGDGRTDIYYSSACPFERLFEAKIWLHNGLSGGMPTFQAPYNALAPGYNLSQMGTQDWGGPVTVTDFNGDRKLDLIIGTGDFANNSTGDSRVQVWLNQCTADLAGSPPAPAPVLCADRPTFALFGNLLDNLFLGDLSATSYDRGEYAVVAYDDFDRDGNADLMLSAAACCNNASQRLRYYPGLAGGNLDTANVQSIDFIGGATSILPGDFDLDGNLDAFVLTDNWNYRYPFNGSNDGIGGNSYVYLNNGTSSPFSGGVSSQVTSHFSPPMWVYDFDIGFTFNYDGDPDDTPDVMIADGNHSSQFYVFANRVVNEYVECGDTASGILDLSAVGLGNTEMVVTGIRIDLDVTLNGGSIKLFASNENPANWVELTDCGDGSGELCAQFDKATGIDIQWKIEMCSNDYHTASPWVGGLDITFDYTEAGIHYRSGVIVYNGIAFAGGFRQPGERGHLFASSAGFTETYFEAGELLDQRSDSSRNLYTTDKFGRELINFETTETSTPALQEAMNSNNESTLADVISWYRSKRFGVGNSGIGMSHLGAIETATPAILGEVMEPFHYDYLSKDDKLKNDKFRETYKDRPRIALVGSKDGFLRGYFFDPMQIKSTLLPNGGEVWAVAPAGVVAEFVTDYSNSIGGDRNITSYPDGSPTVADVVFSDGEWHTVAIVGGGNGNRAVAAFEITDTTNADGTMKNPPQPLWSLTPGYSLAGRSLSKPVIVRAKLNSKERFLAVFGSGIDPSDSARGLIVNAADVETGQVLWQFKTRCPLTSDILAFETNDALEKSTTGADHPARDGYTDRIIFFDQCGNGYKVDPNKDLAGDYNDNSDLGGYPLFEDDGTTPYLNGTDPDTHTQLYAFFRTAETPGAFPSEPGTERPIVGTIGADDELSGDFRTILYFGTGGLESYSPSLNNEFYVVYADTGKIAAKLEGTCLSDGRCEKFYGGVVLTKSQVIVTKSVDPPIGTTTCDTGESHIIAFRREGATETTLDDANVDFDVVVNSAIVAGLFGHGDAVYSSTLSGQMVRIGTPRAAEAGQDTGDVAGQAPAQPGDTGGQSGIVDVNVMGWSQVL